VKGPFTQRIFNTLEQGSECWLKLPYGEFLFPGDIPLILIAGGVGITPYLSLLKQMLEEGSKQAVSLYYGVRNADHYLFADLLQRCEAELPHFRKMVFCEDGTMPGQKGILDIELILADTPAESLFYLSGPPAMILNLQQGLEKRFVPGSRIRVDDWGHIHNEVAP
jgi:ferredoxin-NADP reductase